MIIEYKVDDKSLNCITPCPAGMKDGKDIVRVGSYLCGKCGYHKHLLKGVRRVTCVWDEINTDMGGGVK